MSKTLVFCADGTWNGPGDTSKADGCEPQLTNVCKLFGWLAGELPAGTPWGGAEMEKTLAGPGGRPLQLAKYIHGVGSSALLLDKVNGGAFGLGVTMRIARGYTFLSRNHVDGDRIVIVGFSRGAYTARALAGLIAAEGLLKPELARADDPGRYDTAAAAWYRWRQQRDDAFQHLADSLVELVEMRGAFAKARTLSDASFVRVQVGAVAVWDTVGALGIPAYLAGKAVDLFRFCDTTLSPNVSLGLHAVALDEQRQPFQPTLWDPCGWVTQALFPGGHCDVGGGYVDHGLSDGPLHWFVDRLAQPDVGVQFAPKPPVPVAADAHGPRHRAWAGDPAWLAAGIAPRAFPADLAVDDSVRQRMDGKPENLFGTQGPQAPYAPGNLPGGAG